MKNKFLIFTFCLIGLSGFSQIVNIKIDDNQTPMDPNAPSIFMNPKNTDQLVGGANLD